MDCFHSPGYCSVFQYRFFIFFFEEKNFTIISKLLTKARPTYYDKDGFCVPKNV